MFITAVQSDRAKAGRVLEAVPTGALWLTWLSRGAPLRRVPVSVSHGAEDALETLHRDVVDFTEPGLAGAHRGFVEALDHLVDQFGGMFAPDADGPVTYTEVPPEWKRTDRDLYYQTLRDLSEARNAVLDQHKELMNAMSQQGHMPAPQDPPAGQSFNLNTGDNSPVTVNAPYTYATDGSTPTAGVPQAPSTPQIDPAPSTPWYRSWPKWGVIAGVVGAVAGVIALLK
ncbi:hypothetical protein [Streptomyces sp. NPDC047981]|uniref:hypothetical protein n=1 Tax=Streptomyces sp. NPDC047981 TaxID=3154610 RepID=UPI00343E495A